MTDFPVLSKGQDEKFYQMSQEDPSVRNPMEGGYVISRARHTRKPRKTFTTGFTDLTSADKTVLQNFWDAMQGGSNSFDWIDPSDSVVYQVRFALNTSSGGGTGLTWVYSGQGMTRRWDVSGILLEQV